MNNNLFLIILSASLFASSSFADSRPIYIQEPDSGWDNSPPDYRLNAPTKVTWMGSLSLLAGWENAGETQSIFIAPEIEKTFKADRATHIIGNTEIVAGFQKVFSSTIKGQLGLAVSQSGKATVSGVIWDDLDPEFDNYTYSYSVQRTAISVKGKFLADLDYWVTPWMSCSVGVGINKASSFANAPRISEAVATPNFAAHSMSVITYTVGAGVQKALDDHWQLGLGYEFSNWGKSNLAQGRAQVFNSGLSLSNFYTNGILLNITYVSEGV